MPHVSLSFFKGTLYSIFRLLSIMTLLLICFSYALPKPEIVESSVAEKARQQYLLQQKTWVERQLAGMTLEEKIGQLFMVAAYSNKTESHAREVERLIENQGIGGLIFMQGGPKRQIALTNRFQKAAKVPLLIAMDAEWGLGMRLDSVASYPKQMTLGAIGNNDHIYKMGREIARQCRLMGVHVNFAPVVDVNINPNNPVIGTRSFGEDPKNVAEKGIAYMKGMQQHGLIANAKHFPGHGDTDKDSHLTLPVISHGKTRMDSIELYPFKRLIADSLMSMMVAHLHVPALDSAPNKATTLSSKVVNGLLKNELGFKGLVFTDALNMQGVAKYNAPGEVDAKALLAGNDVLLFPSNVQAGIDAIRKLIDNGEFTVEELELRVRKILAAKYFAGLNDYQPLDSFGIYETLNSNRALLVKQELYEQAVTVVRNPDGLLPFQSLDNQNFASVSIGAPLQNTFQEYLSKYAPFEHYSIANANTAISNYQTVMARVKKNSVVLVSLHKMNERRSTNYGIHSSAIEFINRLSKFTKVVVVSFGSPYALRHLEGASHLVCAYEEDELMMKAVPQVLFGAVANQARLPVTASITIPIGSGYDVTNLQRLGYTFPEAVGVNSSILNHKVDSLMRLAILRSATPGGQVLFAKDGKVIFEKSYGYQTYNKKVPITNESIYDLASLTKVLATLQAVMHLEERQLLEIHKKVADYLAIAKNTSKGNLVWKEILTHQAGLQPYVPLYDKALAQSGLLSGQKSETYPFEVGKNIYSYKHIGDTVKKWTLAYPMRYRRNLYRPYTYRYSDTGFYLLMWAIESITGKSLNDYVDSVFYKPLGLSTLGYLPLDHFPPNAIVPTEWDSKYRKSLLQGYVDDPGAALIGGVGGHAGLFSKANDIAVMMQMNLQNGYYGGRRYFKEGTVDKFNTQPYASSNKNRRAIGWDKPLLSGHGGSTSPYAPHKLYGHTGFTGTCTWADPVNNMVYVFLSNRIQPYIGNKKLIVDDYREDIMSAMYIAMGKDQLRPAR